MTTASRVAATAAIQDSSASRLSSSCSGGILWVDKTLLLPFRSGLAATIYAETAGMKVGRVGRVFALFGHKTQA